MGAIFATFVFMIELIQSQRHYFREGHTKSLKARKETLRKLYHLLFDNEQVLADAINKDFKKSFMLTIENELSLPYGEINHFLRKLNRWAAPRYARTNLVNFPAASRYFQIPLGVCLVIGPWNYPYMLSLIPAISALAAGNTVILKPSEITSNSSRALATLINENFPRELFYVQEGGVKETTELLNQKFDKIFFTGSTEVGKIVMKAAAEHLTPVTLELGGKNPVIVMPGCNLKRAAKRITWGKYHNNGMACVSPDQIYVHESIRQEFVREVKKNIPEILGDDPRQSPALPRMVSEKHYKRVMSLIDPEKVVTGGEGDPDDLYIAPTVMDSVQPGDAVMQEEIFGPVMALLSYSNLATLVDTLKQQPSPLMLYIFTGDVRGAKKLIQEIPSGGAMINDVILQFINLDTPFGGVGESGMGSYHGKAGFDAFSQKKTVMHKYNWFEMFLKYPPYRSFNLRIYRSVIGKSFRNLWR
ncbi:MAG: aldehyde dehydrogenase family protein [Bacteroidetes bacterium]|nr:aldehyde dehydrogenase family protein [Bacteroidota bacterium]